MGEFRVMTWNVQNLFPVGAEDGPDTTAEFSAKLASLAAVIDDVEPDVLCLQEIGTDGALAALQDTLGHEMPISRTRDAGRTRHSCRVPVDSRTARSRRRPPVSGRPAADPGGRRSGRARPGHH